MHRLTLFAALALGAGAASAEDPHWYVQGDAGATFGARADGSPYRSADNGWTISGEVGRDFGDGWRADAEVLYLSAPNRHGVAGSTDVVGGFANGYYNFNHGRAWQPFVGVGIGEADVHSLGAEDSGFAYQVKAGLDHPFNDRLTGEIAYRYLDATGLRDGGPGGARRDFGSSAITIGLRYRFGR